MASLYQGTAPLVDAGVVVIDQVDHGVFTSNNYTLALGTSPGTVAAGTALDFEATLSRYGSGVTGASLTYQVEGTGISGAMAPLGGGRYAASFNVPANPVGQAASYTITVTASHSGTTIVGWRKLVVVPATGVAFVVRSPALITAEDIAFKAALDAHVSSYYLSIADFTAGDFDRGFTPIVAIHFNDNPVPEWWSDPAFGAALKAYMEGGGKVFLSGAAPKVLDLAGITPEVFAMRGVPTGSIS